jgi:transmembrane sensor
VKIYRTTHQERIERASREAAEWLRVMNDAPDAADQDGFVAWVRASPLHLRELLVLQALERELDAPGIWDGFDVDAVVGAAKVKVNVVDLHEVRDGRRPAAGNPDLRRGTGHWRVGAWMQAAVLAGVLILGGGAWLTLAHSDHGQSYATSLGEQRQFTLVDGTTVTMAPTSRISVDFSAHERDITLHAGKAQFDVVHDASRPFRVYAGASVIQDVGTYFSVNRLPSGTVVAVIEGEVKVTANHMSALGDGVGAWFESWLPADLEVIRQPSVAITPLHGQRKITAGQSAHITRNGRELTLTGIEYDRTNSAARAKQLVFHNSVLADIAAEFNRYNTQQIVVEGEAARKQRYSGVIDADDAASFLQYLACCSRLELTQEGNRTMVHSP